MELKCIDLDLKEQLERKSLLVGRVAEISKDMLLIVTKEGLISVIKDEKFIAPLSLVLNEDENLKGLGILVNDEVVFSRSKITLGDGELSIDIEGAEEIKIEKIEYKNCNILYSHILDSLTHIEKCIYCHGHHEGFAPIVFNLGDYLPELKGYTDLRIHNNLYTSFKFGGILTFFEKLVSGKVDDIWIYSKNIIGYGPGITPSSNDFICGLMNTLVYASKSFDLDIDKVYKFNKNLLKEVKEDYEDISYHMMKASVYGNTRDVVVKVISSVLLKEETEILKANVRNLISLGDISGTDILCGIYYGFRLLESIEFKSGLIK